jgi:hypothetical protein
MTKRPPKAKKYQEKVIAFYGDDITRAIISAEARRTGENKSELLRRIVREWAVAYQTQTPG